MLTNKLKDIRKKQGISQQALATAVGVTRQTIHSVEAGKSDPSLELALKIAKRLDLTIEKIFQLKETGHFSKVEDQLPPFSIFGKS